MHAFFIFALASSATFAVPVLRLADGVAVVREETTETHVGNFSSEKAHADVLVDHGANQVMIENPTVPSHGEVVSHEFEGTLSPVKTPQLTDVTSLGKSASKSVLRVRQAVAGVGAVISGLVGEIVTTFQNITSSIGALGGAQAAPAAPAGGDG